MNPPELLNKSMVIPNKKLEIINNCLLPFTGNKMTNKMYGNGLM